MPASARLGPVGPPWHRSLQQGLLPIVGLLLCALLLAACELGFQTQPLDIQSVADEEQTEPELDTHDLDADTADLELEQQDESEEDSLELSELDQVELVDLEQVELEDELEASDELAELDEADEAELPDPCAEANCPLDCCLADEQAVCVDLNQAPEHCGECGRQCAQLCVNGECCTPMTCSSANANCGQLDDGCGGLLSCGSCESPLLCGAHSPNRCGPPQQWPDSPTPYCIDITGAIPCPAPQTAFYGQDGSYLLTQPSYIEHNGWVEDERTGLSWESSSQGPNLYLNGESYCESSNTGGFSNWRLPTQTEIVSLADYGKASGSIHPALIDEDGGIYWLQSPTFGERHIFDTSTGAMGKAELLQTARSRCVRGTLGSALSSTEFGLEDRIFGFAWDLSPTTSPSWEQALSYCEASTHGGFDDWRLPSVGEWMSLLRHAQLPSLPSRVWSSTPRRPNQLTVIQVVTGDRSLDFKSPTGSAAYGCVRNIE